MSAIAGIIHNTDRPMEKATLERMQNALKPYGRDAQHHRTRSNGGLLRTLLRITPEDAFDQQPLQDSSSQTLLVFDGRLDNRDELAHTLGISANELKLMADSQLALRACLRWDTQAPEHLLGDFALACWQPARKRLWLARDPLGARPLFWHQQRDFFAFATMPKALFAIPGVPRTLCEERLADFIALLPVTGPQSFYKDVYRVEPGCVLITENGQTRQHRFHQFDPQRELQLPKDEDYLEAFRECLEQAVASRLRCSGGIASQLSSGFDSSTITALAARQLASVNKGLTAYTAAPREGFNGPVPKGRYADESAGAAALAARFENIEHVILRTNRQSPLTYLQQDIESLDRAPLNPTNMVWMDNIQQTAARHGAKVLLGAQMGNMTISYTGHPYMAEMVKQGQLLRWLREARALHRRGLRWRGVVGMSIGPYFPAGLWLWLQQLRGQGPGQLSDHTAISREFATRVNCLGRARQKGWDLSYRPWADGRKMRIAVLQRGDNAEHRAAANVHGLEIRDPTADRRLIDLCLAIPGHQYLRNGQDRWLLRRLVSNILPEEILATRGKGLQAADWYEGMGDALAEMRDSLAQMLANGQVGHYLDLENLEHLLANWPDDGWDRMDIINQYHMKLSRGLAAGAFIQYVEDNNAQSIAR